MRSLRDKSLRGVGFCWGRGGESLSLLLLSIVERMMDGEGVCGHTKDRYSWGWGFDVKRVDR